MHRFSREKDDDYICDVYDGKLYKELSQDGGFLSEENLYNLSIIFHTDGLSVFKASDMQAWPVQSTICELPMHKR